MSDMAIDSRPVVGAGPSGSASHRPDKILFLQQLVDFVCVVVVVVRDEQAVERGQPSLIFSFAISSMIARDPQSTRKPEPSRARIRRLFWMGMIQSGGVFSIVAA